MVDRNIPPDVLTELMPGIKGYSYKHSFDREQAEDFIQDALLTVLNAYKRYKHLDRDDLVRVLGATAKNSILSSQQASIRRSAHPHSPIEDEYALSSPSHRRPDEEAEINQIVEILEGRLSTAAKSVLAERLNPSRRTLRIIDNKNKEALRARKQGLFKITVTHVTDRVIAESLKMSVKSVRRAGQEIRLVGGQVFSGRE